MNCYPNTIIKVDENYGTKLCNKYLKIASASEEEIKNKLHLYKAIVPANLDIAAKEAIVNNNIELTAEEQSSALRWLGAYEALENLGATKYDKTGGQISGNVQISNDLFVSGNTTLQNVSVLGTLNSVHTEDVYTKNDTITLRDGAVTGLADGKYASITAKLYDGVNDGMLGFDNTGTARVGDVDGTLQALATRAEEDELVDGQVMIWNLTDKKLVGSSDYVKNTDYATTRDYGIIRAGAGIGISSGEIFLSPATNKQIEERTAPYRILSTYNMDYATMSALTDPHNDVWGNDDTLPALARATLNSVGFEDYATKDKAGLIKIAPEAYNGILINTVQTGVATIARATNNIIDARTPNDYFDWGVLDVNRCRPICPANLDYAVKKSLTDNKLAGTDIEWTDDDKTSVKELLGISGFNTIQPNENGEHIINIWETENGVYKITKNSIIFKHINSRLWDTKLDGILIITDSTNPDYTKTFSLYNANAQLVEGKSAATHSSAAATNLYSVRSQISIYGEQTVKGAKTFEAQPLMTADLAAGDSSDKIPNTAWVQGEIKKVEEKYRVIQHITLSEDTHQIDWTQDSEGNPFSLKKARLLIKNASSNSNRLEFYCIKDGEREEYAKFYNAIDARYESNTILLEISETFYERRQYTLSLTVNYTPYALASNKQQAIVKTTLNSFNSFGLYSGIGPTDITNVLKAGTEIIFEGVDYEEIN